jgi:predicted  nucleic acid-binding Zn-ribbon protein
VKIIFAKLTDVASTLGEKILWVFTEPEQAIKDLWGTIKTYFIDKFNEVVKSVGLLGSAFVKLFNRDFSGALADATEGAKGLFMELTPLGVAIETVGAIVENVTPLIGEFVNEVNDAVSAATKLSNRSIQLRKDQRDLALGFAEGRAQIKEYNLVAEDVTQTLEDRLVAAQKAIDIEKALMTERQRLAQEEVDIQKANMALSENVEADQQKLVDLEVALINIRTESAEMQTTLGNKLNIINAQAAAEKATQMKTFLDGLETMGKAEEEATLLRLKNLKVVADAEKATADAVRAARLGIVSAGFDALKSMAKTEEGQKRLAISQILVNQGVAMSQAIAGATTSATALGPGAFVATPLFIAQALGLVLGSFASIKGVMNQAGASSGSVGTSSGGGGGGASAQLALTPTLESFEGDTLELPAVQAYVLQNNIADADALAQALQNQSSL